MTVVPRLRDRLRTLGGAGFVIGLLLRSWNPAVESSKKVTEDFVCRSIALVAEGQLACLVHNWLSILTLHTTVTAAEQNSHSEDAAGHVTSRSKDKDPTRG